MMVESESTQGISYNVTVDAAGIATGCSCPSRTYRPTLACKHMRASVVPVVPVIPIAGVVQVPVGGRQRELRDAYAAGQKRREATHAARVQPWVDARAAWVAAHPRVLMAPLTTPTEPQTEKVRFPRDLAEQFTFVFSGAAWRP